MEKNTGKSFGILTIIAISASALVIMMVLHRCSNGPNNTASGVRVDSIQQASARVNPDSVYTQVDSLPEFRGGDEELLKFIATNAIYPEESKKKNIQGRVIVRFVVNRDCTISGLSIVKSIDPLLDAEALRVISTLPKFTKPAVKDGKVVAVNYMVPITFALK
jgi:TonB family protein